MAKSAWDPSLITGDPTVDSQHKTLFSMVAELHDSILADRQKEVLRSTLEQLADYTVKHFSTEERMMTVKSYPGLAEHKRKHDELTKKAMEIISAYKNGQLVLPLTISQFLADWIRHHINEEDKKLILWMQEHA